MQLHITILKKNLSSTKTNPLLILKEAKKNHKQITIKRKKSQQNFTPISSQKPLHELSKENAWNTIKAP